MREYQRKYAGFWIRFCATLIDSLVLAIPLGAIQGFIIYRREGLSFDELTGFYSPETELYLLLGNLAVGILYFGLMTASKLQGTLGKLAFGLKVVGEDGGRIGFFRSVWRYLGYTPSTLLLFFGFLMVGIDDHKQGLHDKMAKTYVLGNPYNERLR
ncbi:RDD family protein [Planomicrobium sp. YIM 101495]|uniref:RDD family protein n=1 Tax=Planomicrobium sp. YIM 101495 TaxID=2665160 RepID=UPI0012B9240B|nr:RDD family protein [Planomicrobium sp. YIM 101495]MTD31379.1 RDD family protein [Planomicrobium sp. YIM 101495]